MFSQARRSTAATACATPGFLPAPGRPPGTVAHLHTPNCAPQNGFTGAILHQENANQLYVANASERNSIDSTVAGALWTLVLAMCSVRVYEGYRHLTKAGVHIRMELKPTR